MSEPQLISPLLDGFVMGDPISEHDGVRCCPAMHLETEKKYIVKVISVPASNTKLAAMVLAGAFPDRAAALAYFEGLAGDVVEEAALLQKLSRFEGFVSYEGWQLVPMESGDGFDIYLLGAYRPTLEGLLRRNDMTHLAAVNLGLDLCAALSVCRRMGYMYADLQPSNVYICNQEYRIGDLGFLGLSSLEFASLPEKYLSSYTPPEITDAYSALNSTMDTYAVGLLLYQAFNDGLLPFEGRAPEGALIPPRYADYALSEIILKACAPDPQDRWEDPTQMGQALINYLQTSTVNDTPIVPSAPQEEEPEPEEIQESVETEPSTEDILAQVDEALEAAPEIIAPPEELPEEISEPEEIVEEAEEALQEDTPSEEEDPSEDIVPEEDEVPEEAPEELQQEEISEAAEPEVNEESPEAPDAEGSTEEIGEDEESPEEIVEVEESPEEIVEVEESEEEPEEAASENTDSEEAKEDTSEDRETADMLAQADELIAHQLPGPVVAREPGDIAAEETAQEDAQEEEDALSDTTEEPDELDGPDSPEKTPKKQPGKNSLLIGLITGILIGILLIGGFLFYQNFFLQTVYELTLGGTEDKLTVTLNSEIDDELLTVLCADVHGNTIQASVVDGVATFSNLKPNTQYKIQVRISGFHKLQGKTSETYTTASQTTIGSFYAATGHEDGSVILSFTVQGPDSNHWIVRYSAEGEEEKTSDPFTGHMITLSDLTIGKLYTFTLEPVNELYLTGTESVTYVPSKVILAKDLHIVGMQEEGLAVEWSAPEDAEVSQWTVRCYNENGYDKTLTVAEPKALFDGVDPASAYTIEVTAAGMTLSERTYLSENSITIQKIWMDGSSKTEIVVAWDYYGTEPAGGWLLLYSVDGSSEQKVVQCETNRGVITPLLPGSKYSIEVKPANGSTVFGGKDEYQAYEADAFSGYRVSASSITFKMCITPSVANWDRYDVPDKNYTTSFAPGVSASFVMHLTKDYNESDDQIITLYLIRDENGNLVSNATESRTWTNMWYKSYGKLTIPFMPEAPGKYTVEIYFNGTAVTTQSFEIRSA